MAPIDVMRPFSVVTEDLPATLCPHTTPLPSLYISACGIGYASEITNCFTSEKLPKLPGNLSSWLAM